jgi:hypothetical protein
MRTACSCTSGENFGDLLMLAPFSIEGASSKAGAVQFDLDDGEETVCFLNIGAVCKIKTQRLHPEVNSFVSTL